jgi:hypothetical protein
MDEMIRRAERELRTGKIGLTKAATDKELEEKLLKLLMQYGLRQVDSTGRATAATLGGEWLLRPGFIDEILKTKVVRVQGMMKETQALVRKALGDLSRQAAKEKPRPTMGDLARRIRTDTKKLYAFSPERASLIARTESAQMENEARFEGMRVAGVDEIEWLAFKDGRSKKRHHEQMNGERIKVGDKFTTPLGNKLRFPGDPSAPIEDTANCRCTAVPVRRKERRNG